jgi:hypothetical protein
MRRLVNLLATTALLFTFSFVPVAQAGDDVKILVLKEHGVGSASTAQTYVDKLVAAVAAKNGWGNASGKYTTKRKSALKWIEANKPGFGILTLPAYLAMRTSHKLSVVGQAVVKSAGGRQYFLISKTQKDLAGCKGKTLASDHLDDLTFVDKVIGAGAFTSSDFQAVPTRRPVQTLKMVTRGEAECALVDDAQLASLAKLDGGKAVKKVWSSKKLPPMVVVAFGSISKADRTKFKNNLLQVCMGAGKSACAEAGIGSLRPAGNAAYAAIGKAYDK